MTASPLLEVEYKLKVTAIGQSACALYYQSVWNYRAHIKRSYMAEANMKIISSSSGRAARFSAPIKAGVKNIGVDEKKNVFRGGKVIVIQRTLRTASGVVALRPARIKLPKFHTRPFSIFYFPTFPPSFSFCYSILISRISVGIWVKALCRFEHLSLAFIS